MVEKHSNYNNTFSDSETCGWSLQSARGKVLGGGQLHELSLHLRAQIGTNAELKGGHTFPKTSDSESDTDLSERITRAHLAHLREFPFSLVG